MHAPPVQPMRAGALSSEGQGLRAGLLALLDRECAWVGSIRRLTGDASFTELALSLYRYLVFGEDENDVWRDYVIEYGNVDPQLLEKFVATFDEAKAQSAERVIAACKKIPGTKLGMVSDLSVSLPEELAELTVADVLNGNIDEEDIPDVRHVVDFTWLYDIITREITTMAIERLGTEEWAAGEMISCLYEC